MLCKSSCISYKGIPGFCRFCLTALLLSIIFTDTIPIILADTMEILSQRNQALFETTKRLLCEIINEGLADATIEAPEPGGQRQLCLYNRNCSQSGDRVTVNLEPDTIIEMKEDRVISVVRPDSLKPSVLMIKGDTRNQELDPEILFRFMSPWFMGEASETVLEEMAQELRNSANNQGD